MNLDRKNPIYIFVYTVAVAVAFSTVLVLVSQATRQRIAINEEAAEMRAILGALNLEPVFRELEIEFIEEATETGIMEMFRKYVQPSGIPAPVLGVRPYTIYSAVMDGKTVGHAFSINGQGFWGPIYGYLGVEPDLVTIRGVYFYKDEETPGLGHEIRRPWFRKAWEGKRYWPPETAREVGERLASADVASATEIVRSAEPPIGLRFTPRGTEKDYNELDAITGASETTRAVDRFIGEQVQRFLVEMASRGHFPRASEE